MSIPYVPSCCLRPLASDLYGGEGDPAHWHPSPMSQRNISLFQLSCLVSFPSLEGFAPGDRAWPRQEHTQAMQGRERAGTVPEGRARSPRPGLVNLGPFYCLQRYALPVRKNNGLLRMAKDTGATQPAVFPRRRRRGPEHLHF